MQYDKSRANFNSEGWPIQINFDSPEEFAAYSAAKDAGLTFDQFLKNPKIKIALPTPGMSSVDGIVKIDDADALVSSYTLPTVTTALARDGKWLSSWNDTYVDSKDSLTQIIKDSRIYPPATVAAARAQLAQLEADYKQGSATAYAALGKKPSDKDVSSIPQLAVYASSLEPPDTEKVIQSNLDALSGALQTAVNLELKYGPQLTNLAGQAEREQMLKNIQAATDTPVIAALRRKKEDDLSATEKRTLEKYDAQYADVPTAELAARVDTLFNQNIQRGKLAQYSELMPQYKQQYLAQMPGASTILKNLGKLGTEVSAQANIDPQLTAFEQQIQGPTYGQELRTVARPEAGKILNAVEGPMYGQELGQVQGPVAGQYLNQVAGPSVDLTLGGMQAYSPGEFTSNIVGPELQSKLGNIDQRIVDQYMNTMPGVAEGARRLGQQINLDLAAGRSLTEEQERMATQAAREAYAARGMSLGPQAITSEVLGREELAERRYRERQAAAQQAMGTISGLYQPALAQAYARQVGAEQYGLGAQAQMFGQGMSREDLARVAQAQEYQQKFGLEQLGLGAQSQQYQQALGREQLGLTTQAQQFGQAATREQQQAAIQAQKYQQALGKEQLGLSTQEQQFEQAAKREQQQAVIQGQQFSQALSRSEAELNRIQAKNTLKANAAQIASGVLGAQQQALSPAMSAYFNVPPTQGAYATSVNQASNQFEQAGLNIADPTNPVLTGLSMMPYENTLSQYSNQANFAASYMQARASQPSGGGKKGGCCFIMLEARYGNGVMDEVVRRYRDEHVTPRNQRGYYKLAEVFVPLMRKSKLFKFAVAKLFADPSVSYAKWHYGQNKHGWLFKPVQAFWMKIFNLLGEDVQFIRENGEVI